MDTEVCEKRREQMLISGVPKNHTLPRHSAVVNRKCQFFFANVKLPNKVLDLLHQSKVHLGNKPPPLKLLPLTKFHSIWITSSKVMAINLQFLTFLKMAITFEPVGQMG